MESARLCRRAALNFYGQGLRFYGKIEKTWKRRGERMPVNVKSMIADAFVKLAREKNIDKITVKDLVEECSISRQTFYYHFQDLLDVIEWSTEQAFADLLERSLQADDPETVMREFIDASEDASALLQKLLHSQKREQIERLLVRSIRTYLQEMASRRGPAADLSYEDAEVALDFSTYGVVGLLLENCGKKGVDRERRARQIHRLLSGRIDGARQSGKESHA